MSDVDLNAETITIRGLEYERLPSAAGAGPRWGREVEDDMYVEVSTSLAGDGDLFFSSLVLAGGGGRLSEYYLPRPHADGRTPEEAVDNLIRAVRSFADVVEKGLGGAL